MRHPEDREPREICEPKQEEKAVRYELVVRLAPPYSRRKLIVRQYEDGRAQDVTIVIDGPTMVIAGGMRKPCT